MSACVFCKGPLRPHCGSGRSACPWWRCRGCGMVLDPQRHLAYWPATGRAVPWPYTLPRHRAG